jgi:hypothetical protein
MVDTSRTGLTAYTLSCRSDEMASLLANVIRARGPFNVEAAGSVVTFPWSGGMERLIQVGNMAQLLNCATLAEVSKMYVQYASSLGGAQ